MKRAALAIVAFITLSLLFTGCFGLGELESEDGNILFEDTVYERSEFPNYNLTILEDNAEYIGDFIETYDYGNQLPWEVYTLNDEKNVLFSAHALWIRPGYVFPDEYGEEFSRAEYVVAEGLLDTYKEETTPLMSFPSGVTLENIIESSASEIDGYKEYASIRFYYTHHADMTVTLGLFEKDGVFYLSVCEDVAGENVFYKIRDEYVESLISPIPNLI